MCWASIRRRLVSGDGNKLPSHDTIRLKKIPPDQANSCSTKSQNYKSRSKLTFTRL